MTKSFLILVSVVMYSLSLLTAADFLGVKIEYLRTDTSASEPEPRNFTLSLNSGDSYDFGRGLLEDADGNRYTYYWSCEEGKLNSRSRDNNHVVYTAPVVAHTTTDLIYLWVGSESGLSADGLITVTVSPTAAPPQPSVTLTGQLGGVYRAANGQFDLAYILGAGSQFATISASFDGRTWTEVATINPGVDGLNGLKTVTVPDSGSHQQVRFRLQVAGSSGTPQVVRTTSVDYQPIPVAPRTTEIPAKPNLNVTGYVTSTPSVELTWRRVNDSRNDDNVNSYELRYGTDSAFNGATVVNIGNPAAGGNIYETLRHTVNGLADDTNYYFQIRGINGAGTGDWSNRQSIRVQVQDVPVFTGTNPIEPANGATGVGNRPDLRFRATDPDGDSLDYRILFGESAGSLAPIRSFGDATGRGIPEFRSGEWHEALKPNTTYFWKVVAREEGRKLSYYGGTYPSSPVWSFTTANSGSSLTFLSADLLAGTIAPGGRVTYRVTVRNDGNANFAANVIQAFYAKSGGEWEFLTNLGGEIPELEPGQSTITDLTLQFREDLFTSPGGFVYDNVLTSGSSEIRLYPRKRDNQNVGNPSFTIPVNYTGGGGPEITALVLKGNSGDAYTPRSGLVQIIANIKDDLQTVRTLLEYRYNGGSWQALDDYTGNAAAKMFFDQATHSGSTIGVGQNTVNWFLPAGVPLTTSLQVRVTTWDNDGLSTTQTSGNFQVIDNTLSIMAGSTELSHYQPGQQVSFPIEVIAPGPITSYDVTLRSGTKEVTLLSESTADPSGLVIPPVLTVTLPSGDFYDHAGAFLDVYVNAENGAGGFVNDTDSTDGTFVLATKDLPAPFHEAIELFDLYFNFPGSSTGREEFAEPIAMDWEGDDKVHVLFKHLAIYTQSGTDYSIASFYYIVYNRLTGVLTRQSLGSSNEYLDLKVANGVTYLLSRIGNTVSWRSNASGSFSSNASLVTLADAELGYPHLFTSGNDTYFGWVHQADQPSSIKRNRFRKLGSTLGPVLEHSSAYMGSTLNYGTHLSSQRQGVFGLNPDLTAGSQTHTWFSSDVMFKSSDPLVIGAQQTWGGSPSHPFINLAHPGGSTTPWDTHTDNANLRISPGFQIAIGKGQATLSADEGNRHVVVRRDRSTGEEVRLPIGQYGANPMVEVLKRSAINENLWTAFGWRRKLAVGNLNGDIVAPEVEILNSSDSFSVSEGLELEWSQSDQHGSLASYSIYRVDAGVKHLIATSNTGLGATESRNIVLPNQAHVAVRIEVTDNSGNRGVAERVFRQVPSVSITNFAADRTAIEAGEVLRFSWNASPVEPLRAFTILKRLGGTSHWEAVGSATGNELLLKTTGFDGTCEFKIETPGGSAILGQAVTISGGFDFITEAFEPKGGPIVTSALDTSLTLFWDSNRVVSPSVIYRILGRWDGVGGWLELARTDQKEITIDVAGHNSLEWRVATLQEGADLVSPPYLLNLAEIEAPTGLTANVFDLDTAIPGVALTWNPESTAELYLINRVDVEAGITVEIGRVSTESFTDLDVDFGKSYLYRVASAHGRVQSEWGADVPVVIADGSPVGITFMNTDYETVGGNTNTVTWQATESGGTATYRAYEALLKRGDGAIVDHWPTLDSTSGSSVSLPLTGLRFSEGYVLEVFLLNPDGSRVGNTPVRHRFTTGTDTRTINSGPFVTGITGTHSSVVVEWTAAENADQYDIFRQTNSGSFVWVGVTDALRWEDRYTSSGDEVSYFVRARNGHTSSASPASSGFLVPDPPFYQPDVIVGRSLSTGMGDGLYEAVPFSQTLAIKTSRARRVSAYFTVENDGSGEDVLELSGSPGNAFFQAVFRDLEGGNITASVTAGNQETGALAPGEKESLRLEVIPSKRRLAKLSKVRGKAKIRWLRKSYQNLFRAISNTDMVGSDAARVSVQH
ncbi:MAG: fibronectin type III domain-containing protein [Verrucomicrobiae bacterium]|nr:fibronectin type III domain-containing protein [Verrucomicrobiae bacterium]